MKNELNLEWYVYINESSSSKIVVHNVFNHGRFYEAITKNYKKYKDNKEEFLKELKRDLTYYYWCKAEWEVEISPLFLYKEERGKKVDVYSQVFNNWEHFSEYVWRRFSEGKKRKPTEK